MSEIICTECENKEECSTYEILNNTLDDKKEHKKISLKMDFILTVNEPEEFLEDWKEDIVIDVAEQAAELAGFIVDKIGMYNNIVQQLGAHINVESIQNKQAFTEIADYIKETHEQASNR